MVAHACIDSIWEVEKQEGETLKASLNCVVSLRIAWAMKKINMQTPP